MVKRRQQAARIFQFPQPIQPHGIEPFEDIPIFPMLWRAAMFRDKALDFLKPRNDAFFPRRTAALALGFDLNAEFFQQRTARAVADQCVGRYSERIRASRFGISPGSIMARR